MKYWLPPHISKIYEALTAIADNRIELTSETSARCYSSSRGKYYTVSYDPSSNTIMSNDNTAYYTGSLSYPMVALLMLKSVIPYDQSLLPPLSNVKWKDINQKFKNDYDMSVEYVLQSLDQQSVDTKSLRSAITPIYDQACRLKLGYLGKKIKPPTAY